MTRRAFRIGGWAAFVLGTLVALAAASVVVIGTLALTGRVTYPVDVGLGPFSLRQQVSLPVAYGADVCRKAGVTDTLEQQHRRDCLNFFVHDENAPGNRAVRLQDADVRPTTATLRGTVNMATTGGWSGLVAVSVARTALGLIEIGGVLLLLWRLLANSAAGDVFSARAVRHVRIIGWLLIAGSAKASLGLLVSTTGGYQIEMFGAGPFLEPYRDAGVDPVQLALGGLILLLAEAFRHGAAIEAEHRLTV
jgi:Protein of unknown function (DUF2975)